MPETIEAEVVHVEEVKRDPAPDAEAGAPMPEGGKRFAGRGFRSIGGDWKGLRGKVLTLNSRWWPLWVVLGVILLAVVLVVGTVCAVCAVVVGVIRGFLRLLFGGGGGSGSGGGTSMVRR